MLLILAIDIVIVLALVFCARKRGIEGALPCFVFIATLVPDECRVVLPGLFDLTSRRLALTVLLLLYLFSRKKRTVGRIPLKNLIWLHVGWILLSTAASIVFVTSIKQLIAQVIEYYLVYYIFLRTISGIETLHRIAFATLTSVSCACVFGLIEVYGGWSILSIFPAEMQQTYGTGNPLYVELLDRGTRARSVFPHPILFGSALSMTVPIAIYLLVTLAPGWRRLIVNLSILLIFWNLYKTSSRGPWLATILSLAPLLLAGRPKMRKRIAVVALLAVSTLIIRPGIAETIWNMYLASLDSHSQMGASFQFRPALFRTVQQHLAADTVRFLVGHGPGSFREKGLVIEIPGLETHRWYTCDSAWVLFMYETGYVGCLIMACLLFKPAILSAQAFRKMPGPQRYFSLTCFCCLLSFYISMISVAIYAWGQSGYMLWICISVSVSSALLQREEERRRRLSARANALGGQFRERVIPQEMGSRQPILAH